MGNQFKTALLLGLLTAFILWIGNYLGGRAGMGIALFFAGAMNVASYWFSDRIVLGVSGSASVESAVAAHRDYVMSETLATSWQVDQDSPLFTLEKSLGDDRWLIELRKA